MRVVIGDIFHPTYHVGTIVIPTNGVVRKNGTAVMGRGCALQAAKLWPSIDATLGHMLKTKGNHVHPLELHLLPAPVSRGTMVLSFPVKHHWAEDADLALIRRSANELAAWTLGVAGPIWLPAVGCGNGGRSLDQVLPILAGILTDQHVLVLT